MFWVAIKVIFFRQIYGMKHRWVMALCTVLYTAFFLLLLPATRINEKGSSSGEHVNDGNKAVMFGETADDSADIPNPFVIVVTPQDSKTQRLITKAYRILEHDCRNASLFNVHVTFLKNAEHMQRNVEKSVLPSVGVQFHEITSTKLEYTLRPVVVPRALSPGRFGPTLAISVNDELSRGLLKLQHAIDAAYVQTYFPDRKHLEIRDFPSFPPFEENQEERAASLDELGNLYSAGVLVALSLLLMMTMLATYIIRDKLSGVRELLCVNGLPRWMVNTSWLISFVFLALIVALLQLTLIVVPSSNPSIKYVSIPLMLVFLIVYGWTALVFVNFLANVFTSQLLAVLVILLYWLVSTIAGFIIVQTGNLKNLEVAQAVISIVPNFGYVMFMGVLAEFYDVKTELSFGNLFTSPVAYISAGLVLLMMILGIIIFLILALYLDVVKPGPYGRARPWYLFSRKGQASEVHSDDEVSLQDSDFFENTSSREPVGLECVNIVKIFGTHKALDKVNLSIVKNKITVLLGHNGAGKTTLFSILCGMFSPTKGQVYTDEYSVFDGDNIQKFRKVLGYCPQENLVLNELSVQEHLIVFGMLKGLTRKESREFSDKWTKMFDMYNMRHTQAKRLSGGTKRKLCLAIAMTGKPKYLLLDEPSAGMDIESTRKMWDVLLGQKGQCTVVITTHNMDEADVLGDRIAILAHGQLKCLGTSSFLKKTLDSGYRLNCAVTNKSTDSVIKSVNRTIGGASVLYKTNRSVTLSLPSTQVNSIPDLLRGLEREFGESVSSTLSPSTLDEVFIKVQKDMGVKVTVEELPTTAQADMSRSCWNFSELFLKRVKWMLSNRMVTMVIMVIVLPNLAMIGGIFCVYGQIKGKSPTPVSNLADEPRGMFALLSTHHNDVSELLRSALSKNGITFKETSEGLNTALSDMARRDVFEYRSKLLFAFDTRDHDVPTAYFKSRKDHAVAVAYSALINALLQGNATIITRSSPIWMQQNFTTPNIRCPIGPDPFLAGMFFLLVGPFFLVACAYFVVFPHEERTTLFKHLQLMTGLLPVVYWLVNLLFDFLIYICCCAFTVIVLAILNHKVDLFLEPTVLSGIILSLILYGVSSIFLSYVWSNFFRSSAIPIIIIILASLLFSFVFGLLSAVKRVSFEWTFFLPWALLWNSIHKILLWAFNKRDCDKCGHPDACTSLENSPLFAEQLKVEFICFAGHTLAYFLILLFLDHGLGRKLMGLVQRVCFGKVKELDHEVDPEVALEKDRVDVLASMGQDDQPELVCDGLGKKYSCKRTAVYDVTFTAERGECFGLVGVNGAGKSTTFGMLAALLTPTKGTAVIEGRWKVTGCNYSYLKRVGYCPQSEGLLRELPARTIIRLFGRLGGVPRNQIRPLVDKWIDALDMNEIANRPCGHYSGGNKRKLSLAMALIGNPPVVLLDEPTAGVDPVVRRKIWEILTTSLELKERTIILTSHTMSECEAICDRLTIMVKGVMKCLGPIPWLKKTFGKSCILEIKFTPNSSVRQQNAVQSKVEFQFADFIISRDRQPNRLVFLLKLENVKMYVLFATMLNTQSNNAVIEDFSLSETPLEQVFLSFAQNK